MASLKYWLWLTNLEGLTIQQRLALLEHFGQPDKVYFGDSGEYALVEGMTRQAMAALADKSLDGADKILGDCQSLGLRIITIQDAEYPDRLRNIYDPPLVLYVQGRMPAFDDEVAIAMVGSRKVSPYAQMMGEKLAFQMAGLGAVIVSGLAAGGDAAAHRGALRAGGFTAAVIAGGHDVIYPRENRWLYEDIAVRGVILSEYPPGTPHDRTHFPVRNRIISGLCLGTVVIEAPERSGTLITVNHALDQGRDIFALPGQADDWHCTGSNRLLRDGAGVVVDAWDVLSCYAARFPHKLKPFRAEEPRHFGVSAEEKPRSAGKRASRAEEPEELSAEQTQEAAKPQLDLSGDHGLTDDQIKIVRTLGERTMQVDDIIEETEIPTRRVLSALTILELDGVVEQSSGKRFSLAVTLTGQA